MAVTLPGYAYARDVVAGRASTGTLVRLACERALEDLKRWGSKKRAGFWFDAAAAQHAIDFITKLCRHSKGEWAGKALTLEPWQEFIVAMIFGWRGADGTRRFRKAYIQVARKNGKSTMMAAIGLYMLVGDREPGAEVYAAATTRDQAKIIWSEAQRMVQKSPSLLKVVNPLRAALTVESTSSKFEPLSADYGTLDGLNIHAALIDELHAHKTREIYDVLDTATGSRRQPLQLAITTAGFNRQTVCWEEHEDSRKILEGHETDETVFAYIAETDKGDEWTDEKVWCKANPNLGVSVKLDDLRRKAAKATRMPAAQNAFRRLHLDEWTEQDERWLDLAAWDECGAPVDPDELAGRECFVGVDLSSNRDITAAVFFFPSEDEADEPSAVLPFFWVPKENIGQRVRDDGVPYNVWAEQGFIELTPGDVVDQAFILDRLVALKERYEIREVPYDSWGATKIATELQDEGFTVVPMRQNLSTLGPPTKELERMVLARAIAHGGHPVLRWMVGNVAIKQGPDETRKPDKATSRERIDGVSALVMAIGRAQLHSRGGQSVYESRGLLEMDL